MHPLDHYTTIQRGREELLRRAERERLARVAAREGRTSRRVQHAFASWLGARLVKWGEALERIGARGKRRAAGPTPLNVKMQHRA